MKKMVIPGGSGFLGQALRAYLPQDQWAITILTRHPAQGAEGVTELGWDGRTVGDWAAALDGADAVVNLTGKSINSRFTDENRRLIIDSRVDSVHAVAAAIARCDAPPPVWVQASAVGYYGDRGDEWCDETVGPGEGFVAEVCRLWEAALDETEVPATRKVILRIGPVLGRGGGAWPKLSALARVGLGGPVGSGDQYFSWIHLLDMVRMIEWTIETPEVSGAYNACAPTPHTNRELMAAIRKAVGMPIGLPAPEFAVRLAAPIMGMDPSLALEGHRCPPRRATEQGFEFRFEDLPDALADLLG